MAQTFEFNVKLNCGGCVSTIKKTLEPLEGVQSIDACVESQTITVVVHGTSYEEIEKAIKATGKEVKGGRVKDATVS